MGILGGFPIGRVCFLDPIQRDWWPWCFTLPAILQFCWCSTVWSLHDWQLYLHQLPFSKRPSKNWWILTWKLKLIWDSCNSNILFPNWVIVISFGRSQFCPYEASGKFYKLRTHCALCFILFTLQWKPNVSLKLHVDY